MHAEVPEIPKVASPTSAEPGRPIWRRLREPEMIVGLVALAIGLGSLLLGLYEAGLQRHHARAAVWPRLEIVADNTPPAAAIRVRNSGIGPAVINDVLVTVDGKPVRSWEELIDKILVAPPQSYRTSSLADRVLRAGDEVTVLAIPLTDLPSDVASRVKRIGMTIVYSSVYDEHWCLESRSIHGKARISPTSRTKVAGAPESSF